MIPLASPQLAGNESRYLAECVRSTYVSSVGPFVEQFEVEVAAATGSRYCVALSSGTSSLHLGLVVAGVLPGDLVIMPSFTFIATANATRHAGADPWLFDVSADSWTLDADLLRETLTNECRREGSSAVHKVSGRRIGAIIPVHTLGHPADMDEVRAIADEFGIPVIADAAAALGATYKGRSIGELCLASTLSFNGNKTVTCGGGGALITNDSSVAELARHLSTTARIGPGYIHDAVAFNYRLTNIQAAVGCAQLEQLDSFISAKRSIAQRYHEALAQIAPSFPNATWAESAHWMSGVQLTGGDGTINLDRIVQDLRDAGVDARAFWVPMHEQPPYRSSLSTPMPVTNAVARRILTLPSSSGLSEGDQSRVIDAVLNALQRRPIA
jgi:dTDP-4-amino-4,6-dideoxygalactose transaminase